MKKVKCIILIVIILLLLSNNVWATVKVLTIEELADYFNSIKENEGIENVECYKDKIKLISEENYSAEIFYDSENKEFYVEEEFDNATSYEMICNKVGNLGTLPFYGFYAFSEKNQVEEDLYKQYSLENGLLKSIFLQYGIDENMGENKIEYIDNFFGNELIEEMNVNNEFYSIEYSKEKKQDKIIIKNTLKISDNADFFKIADYIKDETVLITKDSADYFIELKVGEKYKIQEEKKLSGYSLKGNSVGPGKSVIEISDDYTEIYALNPGIVKGFIGHEEDKISIYVVVTGDEVDDDKDEDNIDDSKAEDKVDENNDGKEDEKIEDKNDSKEDEKLDNNNDSKEDKVEDENNTKEEDKTIIKEDRLPNTGRNAILYLIITIFLIISIILYIKINKYKYI